MQPDIIEPGYMQPERWEQIARDLPACRHAQGRPQPGPSSTTRPRPACSSSASCSTEASLWPSWSPFSLLVLLGIFLYLYLRLRQEALDRQRLTQELVQREQHYRFVAENSGDVIWTMDTASLRLSLHQPRHLRP